MATTGETFSELEQPLRDFQLGLASIWIVPENRKIYQPLLATA